MGIASRCDSTLSETVSLDNGQNVLIRSVCRKDVQLEREFIEGLSPESRRDRFIGGSCKATDKLLELLTQNDHQQHEAFIAVADSDSSEPRAIGEAHYALDDDGRTCECAIVVDHDWQNTGLDKQLMQRLIDTARDHGIDVIYSIDSAENHRFNHMARAMGFECKADPKDYTLLTYSLHLRPEGTSGASAGRSPGSGRSPG